MSGEESVSEFLLARIGEDEDCAKRAAFGWGAEWTSETDHAEEWSTVHADGKRDMVGCEDGDVTEHIARHDPARTLSECQAKRRVIDLSGEASGLDMQVDGEFLIGFRDTVTEPYLGDVILRALALPYATHPDYRKEWTP